MKHMLPALAGLLLWTSVAQAQSVIVPFRPSFPGRPTVSPYLNLGRGGPAGINYYSLVRPQLEANRTFAHLNQEINQLQTGLPNTGDGAASPVPIYMAYPHFPAMPATGIHPLIPGARRQ